MSSISSKRALPLAKSGQLEAKRSQAYKALRIAVSCVVLHQGPKGQADAVNQLVPITVTVMMQLKWP